MESTLTLKGKVAFVTGATRGIGWATVRMLARQGATVLLNGHSDAVQLAARVAEIQHDFNCEAEGFLFDVANPEAVKECYAAIFKRYKRLDILVNNAGIFSAALLGMVTPAMIDEVCRTNVQGVLLNMNSAARLMARNGYGSIINLSSIIGRYGSSGQVVYAASKAAVIGMTLSASKELAPLNVRVNAVAPGFIDTDMVQQLSVEKQQEALMNIGMKRAGAAEDVANAIYFFASDLSAYVTGQVLGVDGGMTV